MRGTGVVPQSGRRGRREVGVGRRGDEDSVRVKRCGDGDGLTPGSEWTGRRG